MSADREMLAVLVTLEPLDDRKWDYVNLRDRTFDAEGFLEEPLSSGERVLVEVAASLWNTGKVDLGYIACAMGGRHLQSVIDAIAVRGDQVLVSNVTRAIARLGTSDQPEPRPAEPSREHTPDPRELGAARGQSTTRRTGIDRGMEL
ncbi:MAG: hypothetical protein ABR549_12790 [Mycobacteriales bacterium]